MPDPVFRVHQKFTKIPTSPILKTSPKPLTKYGALKGPNSNLVKRLPPIPLFTRSASFGEPTPKTRP